jgi:hypothetical protein
MKNRGCHNKNQFHVDFLKHYFKAENCTFTTAMEIQCKYLTMNFRSRTFITLIFIIIYNMIETMLGGVPVPSAWSVLGLRMEERPPAMEVSCEYIE